MVPAAHCDGGRLGLRVGRETIVAMGDSAATVPPTGHLAANRMHAQRVHDRWKMPAGTANLTGEVDYSFLNIEVVEGWRTWWQLSLLERESRHRDG
jgi:hypothetical protein